MLRHFTSSAPRPKGIQQLVKLSPALSAFMGEAEASRVTVTQKIWAHIKQHNLQNPLNKRSIVPDATLGALFGSAEFSMFALGKKLNDHMFTKPPTPSSDASAACTLNTPEARACPNVGQTNSSSGNVPNHATSTSSEPNERTTSGPSSTFSARFTPWGR